MWALIFSMVGLPPETQVCGRPEDFHRSFLKCYNEKVLEISMGNALILLQDLSLLTQLQYTETEF